MKLRVLLAGVLSLWLTVPALAQVNPGSSPLSGKKGGTNNSFMQFAGPATAIKTFTLPNASGTVGVLNAIATWTAAQSYSDGTLILLGSGSGSATLKAPATGGGTATLFPGNDTIVGQIATQALTNKTFNCASNTCTVRLGSDVTGQLPIGNGGTGAASQTAGFNALAPTATRAGDIIYFDGTNWNHFAGNNSGTNVFSENASGVPSWIAASGSGTVTSAVIAAGTGISVGGTCTITTSGTCTVTNAGVLSVDAQVGAFTTGIGLASTSKVLQLALNNVMFQSPTLVNPAGVAAGSAMMGLASATQTSPCLQTPHHSGRIEFTIQGSMSNNTINNETDVALRFGTGTIPTNGQAISAGTQLGSAETTIDLPAGAKIPFHLSGIATGQTAGVQLWFDAALTASANSSVITNVSCSAKELD